MPLFLKDIADAVSHAANAEPLTVLLPLVVVGIAQGLRAGGPGQLLAYSTRGLLWVGALVVLIGGLLDDGRLSLDAWSVRLADAWDQLILFRFGEALGFWVLLLAASALVLAVRSVIRR